MADVLIIDDDKLICDILVRMMAALGHESQYALTGKEGVELARNGMFDIVFLDVMLPDANGLDLIKTIKATQSCPEIIIITGNSDPDGAEMAIKSGAWNYLGKPFLRQDLNLQVSRALQFRKEKGAVSTPGILKRNGIIGESQEIQFCLDQAAIAAYSDTNVLISGQQGTGKELFAKTIHLNSDRCKNNFVIVDCCTINENNMENLLYGHMKGALPGSVDSKTGLIRLADKGTLFLDEVSELPMQLQRSFLRVIENMTYSPLGSKEDKTSNFRVIATTSQDLDDLSDQGLFRKDLLFKLNGINIYLPELKAIPSDTIKMALFYIEHFCKKYNISPKGISPECFDIISAYEWPGNVRELINAIDKAIASARNESTLYSIHLPAYIKARVVKQSFMPPAVIEKSNADDYEEGKFPLLKKLLEEAEKEYLTALVSYLRGNVKKACRISGLSKSRMYARLKKYKIN
ncbi:MAG: sigma-54 dependent transcriptional regulator [Pseudomonadota bacterium]